MKKSILMACVMLVAGCFVAMAKDDNVVIAGWNVDTGLVTAVSIYVKKEYALPVKIKNVDKKSVKIKDAENSVRGSTNDIVVILASATDKDKPLEFATVIDTKKNLAMVNVDFLAMGITNATVTNQQYYQRVERETMRSVGLLMGYKPCFNPRCVLSNHSGLDGLDKKGRNLCPPCRFKKQ